MTNQPKCKYCGRPLPIPSWKTCDDGPCRVNREVIKHERRQAKVRAMKEKTTH